MLERIIKFFVSLYANPQVASVVQAVLCDLTLHGKDLTVRAIELVKEANSGKIEGSKWEYVSGKLGEEFTTASKSALNTALEAAESAVTQGKV